MEIIDNTYFVITSMEKECFLCLQTTNSVFNIFEELMEGSVILDVPNIIKKYIHFKTDEYNPMLCGKCWNTIKSFHDFCLQIEEAHKNSKRKKQEINKSVFNDKTEIDLENVKNEPDLLDDNKDSVDVSQNGCVEILEIEYCDSNNDISLPECTKTNYKTEEKLANKSALYKFTNNNLKLKIKKLKPSYYLDNKFNDMQSANNFKIPSALSEKIKIENCERKEDTKLISEINNKKEIGIDGSSKIRKKGENRKRRRNKISNKMLQNAAADEKIAKFMILSCELCDETFTTFAALKSHFRVIHQHKGYATCCGYKFILRHRLLDHIDFHLNPENFKCNLCDKAFTFTTNLKKHMKEMHETDREVFNCDQCPKQFISKFSFTRHKASHLPIESWKFPCDKCEKIFPSHFYLWNHKRKQHNTTGICDICGKVVLSKYYKKHMETHDSNYRATAQCPICKKFYWKKYLKNVHLKKHEEAEANEEYICPTCGHKCPNKSALYAHIYNSHTKQRINQYNCTICNKKFKTEAILLEHITGHTDGSSFKKCPFCIRVYKTNQALYTHKIKNHKVEYEAARNKKKEKKSLLKKSKS